MMSGGLLAETAPVVIEQTMVCGALFEVTAESDPGYHFDSWADAPEIEDSIRTVEVSSDTCIMAIFAESCLDYQTTWPVVAKYNWVLMLNLVYIRDTLGYDPRPDQVTWYRATGPLDDIHTTTFPNDDVYLGTGHYLTLEKDLRRTGKYYAVIDLSEIPGIRCDGRARSQIMDYTEAILFVGAGQQDESPAPVRTVAYVCDALGHLLGSYQSLDEAKEALRRLPGNSTFFIHLVAGEEKKTYQFIYH